MFAVGERFPLKIRPTVVSTRVEIYHQPHEINPQLYSWEWEPNYIPVFFNKPQPNTPPPSSLLFCLLLPHYPSPPFVLLPPGSHWFSHTCPCTLSVLIYPCTLVNLLLFTTVWWIVGCWWCFFIFPLLFFQSGEGKMMRLRRLFFLLM